MLYQTPATATTSTAVVCAFGFDRDGLGQRLTIHAAELPRALTDHSWVWVHLALADTRSETWLNLAPISAEARETLLDGDDHLRLEQLGDEIIGVMPDLQRNFTGETQELGRLRFASTGRLLVTARRTPLNSVDLARRDVETGQSFPLPSDLIESIIDHFADALAAIADRLGDELDDVESRLITEDVSDEAGRVIQSRIKSMRVHRQLSQFRTLLHRIVPRLAGSTASTLRALAHKLDAVDDHFGAVYERARLLQDEISARMTALTNRRLFTLSMLTAAILPATFVTGVFGMNTRDLPFQQTPGGTWFALMIAGLAGGLTYWALQRLRAL